MHFDLNKILISLLVKRKGNQILHINLSYLQLYISDFVPRELKFIESDFRLLEVSEEAELLGAQHQQRVAAGAQPARSPSHAVNVFLYK